MLEGKKQTDFENRRSFVALVRTTRHGRYRLRRHYTRHGNQGRWLKFGGSLGHARFAGDGDVVRWM